MILLIVNQAYMTPFLSSQNDLFWKQHSNFAVELYDLNFGRNVDYMDYHWAEYVNSYFY